MNKKNLTSLVVVMLFAILPLQLAPMTVFAQEGEGESEVEEAVEITDPLKEELLIELPEESTNPNYTISFNNPSSEPLLLSIDGNSAVEIESPYPLPTLGIGRHTLEFSFTDAEGVEKEIETDFTIIPRSPEINAPLTDDNGNLIFTGQALPNAQLKLQVDGGGTTRVFQVETEIDGTWEVVYDEELKDGIYYLSGITKKNGYSSNFSESTIFNPTNNNEVIPNDTDESKNNRLQFSFEALQDSPIAEVYSDNPDFAVYTGFVGLVSAIIALLISSLFVRRQDRKMAAELKSKLKATRKAKKSSPSNEATTKESLKSKIKGSKNIKEHSLDPEEVETEAALKSAAKKVKSTASDKESKKNESKEISKEEFLKKYKDHDPDPKDEDKEKSKPEQDEKEDADSKADTKKKSKDKKVKNKKKSKKSNKKDLKNSDDDAKDKVDSKKTESNENKKSNKKKKKKKASKDSKKSKKKKSKSEKKSDSKDSDKEKDDSIKIDMDSKKTTRS